MRDYWQGKLGGGVAALGLAADVRGAADSYIRAVKRFVVPRQLVAQLESVGRQQGATLFMAMLSCIKVLLYRHTAQTDICIGTPVSARPQPELEVQIGAYLNILALRDRVAGEDTLASVLHSVRATTLDGFANQLYPFDRVVEDLRLKRIPGRNPLFDVGFTLQNQNDVQVRESPRRLRLTEIVRNNESFADPEAVTDLWFVARNDEGGLAVQVVYNGARFSLERVDHLSQDLMKIVSIAAANPDTKVKAIPLTASDGPSAGRKITIDLGL
jgi:non-ribosomal peptide synthetase component F